MNKETTGVIIVIFAVIAVGVVIVAHGVNSLSCEKEQAEAREAVNRQAITDLGLDVYEAEYNSPEITIRVETPETFKDRAVRVNATELYKIGNDKLNNDYYVVIDSDFNYAWKYNPNEFSNNVGENLVTILCGGGLVFCFVVIVPALWLSGEVV